jgi:hypothetical protein
VPGEWRANGRNDMIHMDEVHRIGLAKAGPAWVALSDRLINTSREHVYLLLLKVKTEAEEGYRSSKTGEADLG